MTYTHCQNCGAPKPAWNQGATCLTCGWLYAPIPEKNTPINWHEDTPTGWTPERAKACYDACEGVPTEDLTPGCLKAAMNAALTAKTE